MKIGIIGASKGVGYSLLTLALEENHQVSALLRNPSKITIENHNLNIIKGNIRDPEAVQSIVKNQDAICICIGIPPTQKPVDVFSIGAKKCLTSYGIRIISSEINLRQWYRSRRNKRTWRLFIRSHLKPPTTQNNLPR